VVIVTLAEDMPVNESLELHGAVTNELHLPVAHLVVNQVLPRLFQPKERDDVAGLAARTTPGAPLHGLAVAGRTRAARETIQEQSLAKLASALPNVPRTTLPMLFTPEFRRAQIDALAEPFAA
jgi:hypothetical protein